LRSEASSVTMFSKAESAFENIITQIISKQRFDDRRRR